MRAREDGVSESVLAALSGTHQQLARLNYYANKYIAHKADPRNRKKPSAEPARLSLRYLQELHETAIWLARSTGKLVDQLVMSEVPTPQFDPLDG
jgi:hypothetical protein